MKSLLKISFALLTGLMLLTACDDDDNDGLKGLSLSKSEITVGSTGGSEAIKVVSGTKWTVRASEPWLRIEPANGIGEVECQVMVDTTLSNSIRTAVLTFIPEGQSPQKLNVAQTGYGKVIALKNKEVQVANMGKLGARFFELEVTSNVEYTVEIPAEAKSWLKLDKAPKFPENAGARPQTVKLKFNWEMNTTPDERVANVSFKPKNSSDVLEESAELKVAQKAAPLIEDNRGGDSIALLIIREKMATMVGWDVNERMEFWRGVTLWEKTDKGVKPEMVGRVRSVEFRLLATKEALPQELSNLKYLETLYVFGNSNTNLLPQSFSMGTALAQLKNLKRLTIAYYGLGTFNPFTELTEPMKTLEHLDLNGSYFSSFPTTISSYNFPKLTSLSMGGMRRSESKVDLRDEVWKDDGGMRINVSTLTNLFQWTSLKKLRLSFGYIYGQIPDMKFQAPKWTAAQIAANDTLNSASDLNKQRLMGDIPCVLPNLEEFSINLNFLTGDIPEWLLYHPRLGNFAPYILVFQQESGYDRDGKVPGFNNEPDNMDYFYEFYPAAKPKVMD